VSLRSVKAPIRGGGRTSSSGRIADQWLWALVILAGIVVVVGAGLVAFAFWGRLLISLLAGSLVFGAVYLVVTLGAKLMPRAMPGRPELDDYQEFVRLADLYVRLRDAGEPGRRPGWRAVLGVAAGEERLEAVEAAYARRHQQVERKGGTVPTNVREGLLLAMRDARVALRR
jgi:hypothetical protein